MPLQGQAYQPADQIGVGHSTCFHSLVNILIGVNPGMVFSSLRYSTPVGRSNKKSTRAIPAQSMARKAGSPVAAPVLLFRVGSRWNQQLRSSSIYLAA